MKQDITCVFEGVAGVGGIYISNLKAAQNIQLLNSNKYLIFEDLNIKAIVTANRNGIVQHDKSDINDHLYVPADDVETYDLSKHFEETYNFIDCVRKKTNVLVHCYAGISRSATIVIAYLLRKYNYSLQNVITMVKRRRGKINPNKGFLEQLKKQALKMGIVSNEKQQPVEQVLRRSSFSVQRRRGFSAGSIKRYMDKNKSPTKNNMISLCSNKYAQNFNMTGSSLVQNKIDLQFSYKETGQNLKNQSCNTFQKQKQKDISLLQLQYQSQKIGSQYTETKAQTQNNQSFSPKVESKKQISQSIQSKLFLCEKFQKIERLKAKILQSQKRRKSQQKRSNSEINPQKNLIKQKTKQIKPRFDNVNQIVSMKLNYKSDDLKNYPPTNKKSQDDVNKSEHINHIKLNQKQSLFS